MPVQPSPAGDTSGDTETRREQGGRWLARLWTQLVAHLPMSLSLAAVAAVWVFGAVWSYAEQTAFAVAKTFEYPTLLPLVIDGFAIATAGVAFAASLDGRPATFARLMTVLGVAASSVSNGVWAAQRSVGGHGPDVTTVVIGVGIPVAANIAFEVLLAELRRQVQRRRGLPAPVALPSLRMIRFVLAPVPTFREWRREVLERTAQTHAATTTSAVDVQLSTAPIPTVSTSVSTPVDSAPEPEPTPEPMLRSLHVVDTPPAGVVQPAEPVDEEPGQHPDPLLQVGTYRKAKQAAHVAKQLGVTRRSASWTTADFNAAIDDHIRTHGPKPAAPEYKEAR